MLRGLAKTLECGGLGGTDIPESRGAVILFFSSFASQVLSFSTCPVSVLTRAGISTLIASTRMRVHFVGDIAMLIAPAQSSVAGA